MNRSKRQLILRDEEIEKRAIREFFEGKSFGFFVEVGANEPDAPESQTYHLELAGWNGLLIEPIPELAEKAVQLRPKSKVRQAACTSSHQEGVIDFLIPIHENQPVTGHASIKANIDEHNYSTFKTIKVHATSLNRILDDEKITKIDFLSIDVEGAEFEVLQGLDLQRYRPSLILLEDKHLYLKKHNYLKRNRYKLVRRLNRNCWYVPEEFPSPEVKFSDRLRLWKRMYVSIWIRKFQYAIRHKSLDPFKTL